ncbi:hypothetical protein [Paenibacillus polymyxa]|uniref:hypothetical protein n=1 Tax=Paenibacillus polymyxa TaxID=1406 RepID=UPI0015D5A345|nr:hypothetical protein [Paenibacillus polymyxa]
MSSKLHKAFVVYLTENYNVDQKRAADIANGMEYYFQESYMPDVVAMYDLKEG